jgi:prefoldin beta subunit
MADTDVAQRVEKLTLLDQNLQQLLSQKQQFQSQLFEVENALKELESTEKAYKIVGNIMVSTKKEDLVGDLAEKKELLNLRVLSIEKQEKDLKAQADDLRKEVFK